MRYTSLTFTSILNSDLWWWLDFERLKSVDGYHELWPGRENAFFRYKCHNKVDSIAREAVICTSSICEYYTSPPPQLWQNLCCIWGYIMYHVCCIFCSWEILKSFPTISTYTKFLVPFHLTCMQSSIINGATRNQQLKIMTVLYSHLSSPSLSSPIIYPLFFVGWNEKTVINLRLLSFQYYTAITNWCEESSKHSTKVTDNR